MITGPNGSGKTNVLEAISFLAPGKGLRRAKLKDIDCQTTQPRQAWGNVVTLTDGVQFYKVGTGRAPQKASLQKTEKNSPSNVHSLDAPLPQSSYLTDKRIIKLDDQVIEQKQLAELTSVHWVTPEMDRLFTDSRSERRRFIDILSSSFDSEHLDRCQQYERLIKQRLALLYKGDLQSSWLDVLEDQIAAFGVAIAVARASTAKTINQSAACHNQSPKFNIRFEGYIEGMLADLPALEVESLFQEELKKNRFHDRDKGKTHFGPHRSDFDIHHLDKDIHVSMTSTGEQKSVLLSIILIFAQNLEFIKGKKPIFLFDEIMAHLDSKKREIFFDKIIDLGIQAWFTGTDPKQFSAMKENADFLTISDGHLISLCA